MVRAIFPGTFDPLTNGHFDLISRSAAIFSELWLGIAANPAKATLLALDERVYLAKQVSASFANVTVVAVEGLLVEYAKKHDITLIVRGLRTSHDFEYEFQLAGMNRSMVPDLETVFLTPIEHTLFISSTLVKEILKYGGDVAPFVPAIIAQYLKTHHGPLHH